MQCSSICIMSKLENTYKQYGTLLLPHMRGFTEVNRQVASNPDLAKSIDPVLGLDVDHEFLRSIVTTLLTTKVTSHRYLATITEDCNIPDQFVDAFPALKELIPNYKSILPNEVGSYTYTLRALTTYSNTQGTTYNDVSIVRVGDTVLRFAPFIASVKKLWSHDSEVMELARKFKPTLPYTDEDLWYLLRDYLHVNHSTLHVKANIVHLHRYFTHYVEDPASIRYKLADLHKKFVKSTDFDRATQVTHYQGTAGELCKERIELIHRLYPDFNIPRNFTYNQFAIGVWFHTEMLNNGEEFIKFFKPYGYTLEDYYASLVERKRMRRQKGIKYLHKELHNHILNIADSAELYNVIHSESYSSVRLATILGDSDQYPLPAEKRVLLEDFHTLQKNKYNIYLKDIPLQVLEEPLLTPEQQALYDNLDSIKADLDSGALTQGTAYTDVLTKRLRATARSKDPLVYWFSRVTGTSYTALRALTLGHYYLPGKVVRFKHTVQAAPEYYSERLGLITGVLNGKLDKISPDLYIAGWEAGKWLANKQGLASEDLLIAQALDFFKIPKAVAR